MSTPRPPDLPGGLSSVMLRALAAELADPGRFSRAKSYARDGAVTRLHVEPGAAQAEVRGSRFEPYRVTIAVERTARVSSWWELVPDRDEVAAACTCPDDAPYGFCKHSLAVLLVLADEIGADPDQLARWRTGSPSAPASPGAANSSVDADADVVLLAITAPAPLPSLPRLPTRLPVAIGPGDEFTADVLADALATLRSG